MLATPRLGFSDRARDAMHLLAEMHRASRQAQRDVAACRETMIKTRDQSRQLIDEIDRLLANR